MSRGPPNTFWNHVDELAKRLKVVLVVFIISTIIVIFIPANVSFFSNPNDYQPWISVFLRSIRERVLPSNVRLIALQITDPIELYVVASFIFSIGITLPVFAYETYKFVDPAFHPREKKEIYPFIGIVTALFIIGATLGFFILFPFFIWSMFPFFSAVGAELMFSLMDFYNILFFTIVSTGLVFTFPAFFVLLVKYGIIRTEKFRKNRKYLYAGLVMMAMFISPGASPQGDLFLFASMIALFEGTLLFSRKYEKNGEARHIEFFPEPKCKFCGASLQKSTTACSSCGKFQQ